MSLTGEGRHLLPRHLGDRSGGGKDLLGESLDLLDRDLRREGVDLVELLGAPLVGSAPGLLSLGQDDRRLVVCPVLHEAEGLHGLLKGGAGDLLHEDLHLLLGHLRNVAGDA